MKIKLNKEKKKEYIEIDKVRHLINSSESFAEFIDLFEQEVLKQNG